MSAIRVLIVDDSALMRQLLTELLSRDSGIEVVGGAPDPLIAREMIKLLNPDVLTLDVEMPRMDGLTFLENLMRLRPMPVVMVSSLTESGAEVTLQALELGAIDFITKPKIDLAQGMNVAAEELIEKIRMAARARVRQRQPVPAAVVRAVKTGVHLCRPTEKVIALGASTGGTEAIRDVLEQMPADAPAMLITQHIPAMFSKPFAERMNRSSAMTVCQAEDGQPVLPGHAYIAPGDKHLLLVREAGRYLCRLSDAPPENRHRPSVDALFRSVALHAGHNAVGAILTGMGEDGARGLLMLRDAGARTLAQDEASCVVWGMPGAAVRLGAAEEVVALRAVASRLLLLTSEPIRRIPPVQALRPRAANDFT